MNQIQRIEKRRRHRHLTVDSSLPLLEAFEDQHPGFLRVYVNKDQLVGRYYIVPDPGRENDPPRRVDKFTIDLLSNDEVLDINQDPLGKPAGRVAMNGDLEVWSRPLSDGASKVAGYRLLGAIVTAPGGNIFVKCTGPLKTIGANQPKIEQLLSSFQPQK